MDRNETTRDALSVAEFCTRNSLGRSTFYALLKRGEGPRIIRIGRRTLISARYWRMPASSGRSGLVIRTSLVAI